MFLSHDVSFIVERFLYLELKDKYVEGACNSKETKLVVDDVFGFRSKGVFVDNTTLVIMEEVMEDVTQTKACVTQEVIQKVTQTESNPVTQTEPDVTQNSCLKC